MSYAPLSRVYDTALGYAYTHMKLDWRNAKVVGDRTFAVERVPRINLGTQTGKTTAAADWARVFQDTVVVCADAGKASRLMARTGTRAYDVSKLMALKPDHFDSSAPLFVFDDVPLAHMVDVVTRFKPTRAIHLGLTG